MSHIFVSKVRRYCRFPVVLAAVSLLGVLPGSAKAQGPSGGEGRILGRIVDETTAQPLSGVQVYLAESQQGAITDLNGRYLILKVSPGPHDLVVEMLGFTRKTVTGLFMDEGGTLSMDIALAPMVIELEAITVSAEREQGSTAFLLDARAGSVSLVDAVGAAQIRRSTDSDAADVAKHMPGVTVNDGKYVFIRGLGERYSQTALNGSPLPSPEPEKEVVPLDLFPAGFLESLTAQKSYTPDQPADFSSGSIQIKTKDFPDRFALRFGMSTSLNTNSQFQDGFIRYDKGGLDWLGFDDGIRDLPKAADRLMGKVRDGGRLPTDDAGRIAVGNSLKEARMAFAPRLGTTPLNRSFDLSVGSRIGAFDNGEFGYFLAGSYSDSYRRIDDEIERKWRKEAFDPITADLATPNVDYGFERGTRNVTWGILGNVALRPTPSHKISLRATVNLNTDDEGRTYSGENGEDIGGRVRTERSRFVQRLMVWGQLSGEHRLFWDSKFDWRATLARAGRDEPFLRETIYLEDNDDTFRLLDFTESGRYFWSELVDDDVSGEFDWRIPFQLLSRKGEVKVGAAYRNRTRDFGARRLNWLFLGSTIEDLDSSLKSAAIVARAPKAGEFAIDEVVEPGDVYDADDERVAGYAMIQLPVTDKLQAVIGARIENYKLALNSRTRFGIDSTVASVWETDIVPAVNLVYSFRSNVQLRSGVSRTLDRPEFRELAPFQFTEATSLRQLKGNPELVPAEIISGDLRVDWSPSIGEMVSVGAFYKSLTDPIEQVFVAAASSAYSFQNAEEATLIGVELDVQIRADRFADVLENVSLQGNFTWIDSEVSVKKDGIFQPTNLRRPLEGQASYVLNLGVNYTSLGGLQASVFFNRLGERITAAGGSGLPDIFEQPRNALDATLSFPLTQGVQVRVKGTNLLDADFSFEQSGNGITRVQRSYSLGRTFSVGFSWDF